MTSSLDSIYKKMASSVDAGQAHSQAQETVSEFDPMKHVSPVIAHELNNILTIIQGYTDRMLIKHIDDKTLRPQLKMIAEAARRAAAIIRAATPQQQVTVPIRQTPSEPEPTAA